MSALTQLDRPILRRLAGSSLVVRIRAEGVELRGYRRRKRHLVSWSQIAALADQHEFPLIASEEQAIGTRNLSKLGATGSAGSTKHETSNPKSSI